MTTEDIITLPSPSSIGEGLIGKEAFKAIIQHDATENIPLILETPNEERWPEEVKMLLEF